MLFCEKFLSFIPQTLTKFLLSQDEGLPLHLWYFTIHIWCCHAAVDIVHIPSILKKCFTEKHAMSECSLSEVHLCTENTTVLSEACQVYLQKAEARRISRLSAVLGSLHQNPYSHHQQIQTWAPGCMSVLQCAV